MNPMRYVAIVFLVASLSAAAQDSAQSAKNRAQVLTATLTSDRTNYSLADDIRLDARVTNTGKSLLTVFGELPREAYLVQQNQGACNRRRIMSRRARMWRRPPRNTMAAPIGLIVWTC